MVLDTSGNIGSTYASDVVPAVLEFIKRLPQGSRYGIWTTSDRPKVLVELGAGTDLKATEERLRSTPTLGNNAAVETVVLASQEVAKAEGRRSAVVLVTSATMGDVRADVQALLSKASIRPMYVAVEFVQGGGQGDARLEDAIKFLVGRTAGSHERYSRRWPSTPSCARRSICWSAGPSGVETTDGPAANQNRGQSQPEGHQGRPGATPFDHLVGFTVHGFTGSQVHQVHGSEMPLDLHCTRSLYP